MLNAAALTHYSYALMTRPAGTAPLVEVHICNIAARAGGAVPAHSVITPVADGIIAGFGFQSYALALRAVASLLEHA